ncbi:MAG TPA: serine/threonine-protein kinase [Polyangium sp.]|nr:serine/threonine-protein kinase [Polyangium sp.]
MQGSWEPGTVILDKYRVERMLGQGGMGVVLAARHLHLGELFAIKVLSPQAANRRTAVERFVREARAAARLKNEHVARVHDVGYLNDDTPYMVMEYLDGNDLERELELRGTLSVADAVLYTYQVCEGILEAHAHGIVHRDLKPANLFLVRLVNGAPCIKVLDFGISKVAEPLERKKDELTETGALLGSPMYMPPEQIMDGKVSDVRCDIWAIGAIFYELLRGKPPFEADELMELIRLLTKTTPAKLQEVRTDVPEELEAVILKCLEKHPRNRFQSISELMSALHPFVRQGIPGYVPSAPTVELGLGSLHGGAPALPIASGEATNTEAENSLAEQPPRSAPPAGAWGTTQSRRPLGSARVRWIAGMATITSMCLGGVVGLLWRMPSKSSGAENGPEESAVPAASASPTMASMNSAAASVFPSPTTSADAGLVPTKPTTKTAAPTPRPRKPTPGHESND